MKKLLLTGILMSMPFYAMAYIDEGKTADIDYMRAQGYSESTLQIVDMQNERHLGQNNHYVRHFQPKKHRGLGKAYEELKTYWDPSQDDGRFGRHEIEYSNTWQGDKTFYSSEIKENVDNL